MRFDIGILATQPVETIVRQVQLAESLGFHTAWIADSHLVCRELYVTGSGPRMLAAAGRLGDGVIMYSSTSPPIIETALGHIASGAREAGKALEDLDVVIWAPMSVARDRALARDHVRGRVASAMR